MAIEVEDGVLDFFLEQKAPSMTLRELAAETGIPKSNLGRRLKKMGVKTRAGKHSDTPSRASGTSGTRMPVRSDDTRSELERLSEHRDWLYLQMQDASAASVPRLSSEYRATMERIAELSAGSEDDYDDSLDEYD